MAKQITKQLSILKYSIMGALNGYELDTTDSLVSKSTIIELLKDWLKILSDIDKIMSDIPIPPPQPTREEKTCPTCDEN